VETVKGYATHEQATLEQVISARNRAVAASSPAEQASAEQAVSGALANVFALSEAYPDLKANQNFLALQEELTTSEDRVAYARQYYNDAVNRYNTKIETVPSVFLARMAGYRPRQYFQAEGDARGPVDVSF
jgi:LemA protein